MAFHQFVVLAKEIPDASIAVQRCMNVELSELITHEVSKFVFGLRP